MTREKRGPTAMLRIVSIWLPQWPIERLARAADEGARPRARDDVPFALVDARDGTLVLSAANAAARGAGLHPGLALADARARCPTLASASADPQADARALVRLARWCGRYAPSFNTDGADGLWIDSAGAAHLLGGEAALLDDLARRLKGLGFTARLGLADTAGAAWALARFGADFAHGDSVRFAAGPPRGQPDRAARVRACLAPLGFEGLLSALRPLPVEGLRLEADAVTLLKRLGLKRIGQLEALPRVSLKRRFPSKETARAVLNRLDQALGRVPEPLTPLLPPPRHQARLAFPEPLISHEGVAAALERLVRDLCAQLARTLAGARGLALTIYRCDGACARVSTGFAAPCRTAPHMLRLLAEKAESLDAGPGIDAMTLAALTVEPLPARQTGFAGAARAEPLSRLIDRLSNRLTRARVVRAAPRDSHLPERAQAWRPAINFAHGSPPGPDAFSTAAVKPPRPALLLERPEPIAVLAEVPEGPPVHFTWRRATRRVVRAQGPERIASEWWREIDSAHGKTTSPLEGEVGDPGAGPGSPGGGWQKKSLAPDPCARTRDYYRIEDEAGARYWVFRAGLYDRAEGEEGEPPRWYLHGVLG